MKLTNIVSIGIVVMGVLALLLGCESAGANDDDTGSGTGSLLIDSPKDPADDGADKYFRGFYILSYPGTSLSEVELWMYGSVAGDYTLELIARDGTYDGTELGRSQVTVTLSGTETNTSVVSFEFSGTPSVTTGNTVTFEIDQISEPTRGEAYYSLYTTNANGIVKQTNGTTAPLDSARRDEIAIRVYE